MKPKYIKILYLFISIFCILLIFKYIHYLVKYNYIIECFNTFTSDLPLTNTYSCKNFCGPTSRCYITGQQCMADMDCPGCIPKQKKNEKNHRDCIQGNNGAGKLNVGVTPTYSSLTSGYGTKEKIITKDLNEKPKQSDFGINIWKSKFDETYNLFNRRYKPNELQYMPKYKPMYSITGEFLGDGPLPANY